MKGKTILLVEDNPNILAANREVLEAEGCRVLAAGTLAEAAAAIEQEQPHLIVLDILLPDGNALERCGAVFGDARPPILFLSALGGREDVRAGLKTGDDYITKPYLMDELLARVEHLLEKAVEPPPRLMAYGPLELNLVANQAFLLGEDLLLSQKEFAILLLLAQNQGKVLEKRYIYETVWGRPMADNSRALYTTISRLKGKLIRRGEPVELQAVRNDGYRLDIP